jgi:hypothetical protein
VNVGDLNKFDDGARVDEMALRAVGLANGKSAGIKILGNGELTKKLDRKRERVQRVREDENRSQGRHVLKSSAANPPPPKPDAGLIHVPQHLQHVRQLLQNPGAEVPDLVHAVCAGGRRLIAFIRFPVWTARRW